MSPWCETPQWPHEALGIQPHQRSSGELQALGCALAVFVPFATAARLLGWYSGSIVSPQAVWGWVQAAGQQAMETPRSTCMLAARRPASAGGAGGRAGRCSLVLGADGVLVLFRPTGGQPTGKTHVRSQSRGVGPLEPASHAHRQGHHPAAPASAGGGLGGYRGAWPRLWLEAVRQGISTAPGGLAQ